jgi:hypothetical protein
MVVMCSCSAGAKAPSRGAYIRAADSICSRAHREIAGLGRPTGSIAQQAALTRRRNGLERAALGRVRRLTAPPGDRDRLGQIYAEVADALAQGDRSADAIVRGDGATANAAALRGRAEAADASRRLAAYGLTDCVQP